jgi:hypothetical protein
VVEEEGSGLGRDAPRSLSFRAARCEVVENENDDDDTVAEREGRIAERDVRRGVVRIIARE